MATATRIFTTRTIAEHTHPHSTAACSWVLSSIRPKVMRAKDGSLRGSGFTFLRFVCIWSGCPAELLVSQESVEAAVNDEVPA